MLNFKPLLGPQYWSGCQDFDKLIDSTLFDDAWIVFS